jgi:hypothetical protein
VASWFRDFNRHQTLHFYHYLFTRLVHGYTGEERRRFPDRRLAYTGVALPYLALNGREVPFDSHLAVIRADQFDWPMNRTYVQARMIGAKPSRRIEARLQHTMPFFDHFEVAAGDGGWRRIQGDTFRLVLPAARTRFRGRCVDCFGLPGHDAGLRTEVRPKA